MNRRTIVYLVGTTACLSLGSLAGFAAQATGDQWTVTPVMAMQGVTFPMPPQQVCSPTNWTQPPAGSGPDPTCVNSNFAMAGQKATWTITCQNPPSTGMGEITRMGANAWSGSINFSSAQGNMTINLSATRTGACTP
jgi:uncharacterized protein DUF3617